ncbi:MAG: hypothetical protein AAGI14_04540 [Pseudomonadota bacterium]
MKDRKHIRLPDDHPDFRTDPKSWSDFASRANIIVELVLDEYWEDTNHNDIRQKHNRLGEVLDFLREFDPSNPVNELARNFFRDVYHWLMKLRPKPEFRNPKYDFREIRRNLLQDWARLRDKLEAQE